MPVVFVRLILPRFWLNEVRGDFCSFMFFRSDVLVILKAKLFVAAGKFAEHGRVAMTCYRVLADLSIDHEIIVLVPGESTP